MRTAVTQWRLVYQLSLSKKAFPPSFLIIISRKLQYNLISDYFDTRTPPSNASHG